MKVLETKRLVLRHAESSDAPFILELLNDPGYITFIADRGIRTIAAAQDYITTRFTESYQKFGFGLYITELKENKLPVGVAGLVKRDTLKDVDIGFAFLASHARQGYGFESATGVVAYARDVVKLKRLVGITDADNLPSINLLEKLGMTYEGMVNAVPEKPSKLFGMEL